MWALRAVSSPPGRAEHEEAQGTQVGAAVAQRGQRVRRRRPATAAPMSQAQQQCERAVDAGQVEQPGPSVGARAAGSSLGQLPQRLRQRAHRDHREAAEPDAAPDPGLAVCITSAATSSPCRARRRFSHRDGDERRDA